MYTNINKYINILYIIIKYVNIMLHTNIKYVNILYMIIKYIIHDYKIYYTKFIYNGIL